MRGSSKIGVIGDIGNWFKRVFGSKSGRGWKCSIAVYTCTRCCSKSTGGTGLQASHSILMHGKRKEEEDYGLFVNGELSAVGESSSALSTEGAQGYSSGPPRASLATLRNASTLWSECGPENEVNKDAKTSKVGPESDILQKAVNVVHLRFN